MDIVIVVAVARNCVIGHEGGLPWRLSTDLKRFKETTMGSAVIMGRTTYEGIGKPLPGRLNIIVTRNRNWSAEGVDVAHSLEEAIALAEAHAGTMSGPSAAFIIGGGKIFEQALDLADRLDVTHVEAEPEGDTYFPAIDPSVWRPVASSDYPAGERDSHPTRHVIYERITP
ncbi:MAG: dihydrofolate reductase [Rhizobiaceae bacterium]|nr:dihydrofolate reductase [Rhizobiaceae bacterium]MCV0407385.1 dihydrofolate reductase [Rhizobiaceae bacterium]